MAEEEKIESEEGELTEETGEESTEKAEETEETEGETSQTEQAAKTEESATSKDKEERDRVQERIDHLTWEREETKRKLDLFKRIGPEKYYEVYPDEKPDNFQPDGARKEEVEDYESMLITGGSYDGWTLGDLAKEKPLLATKMLNEYLDGQRQAREEAAKKETLSKEAWRTDVNTFGENLATDLYGKGGKDLSDDERKKVTDVIWQVDEWMRKNRKTGYSYSDAYLIMNKDNLIKDATGKAISGVVGALKKSPVGSVSGKAGSGSASTNWDDMSEADLERAIMGMNDRETEEFYSKASPALRKKFPSMPWG